MESRWTDESAILRDLSLAQGQWVPGGIEALVAGEKPPTPVIAEETEEDYFKHWTTDADFSTGPDLSLIKKMLEMVHDEDPEDEDSSPAPPAEIEITKVNPVPVPKPYMPLPKNMHKPKEKPVKPRRARNVAMASLLANEQMVGTPEVPLKLSKPEDFIKTKQKPSKNKDEIDALERKNESVKKVNSWLHMQNMSSMFKKKTSPKAVDETLKRGSEDRSSRKKYTISMSGGEQYTPSSWAGEYYQTCVKRSHMQQLFKENIWDRAEKIMKEIDDRKAEEIRKQQEVDAALTAILEAAEAEIAEAAEENVDDNSEEHEEATKELIGIEKIELPQHRHLLTGECIVCKVLTKKDITDAIQFKEEKYTVQEPRSPSPEIFEDRPPEVRHSEEESNEMSFNESEEHDQEIFSLVRATFVENLTTLDTTDLKCMLTEPGSLEELDIFA